MFKNTSDNDIIKFHTKSRGSISGESDTTTSLRKRIKFLENKLQECKCKVGRREEGREGMGGRGERVIGVIQIARKGKKVKVLSCEYGHTSLQVKQLQQH